jgi:hypothetical protein
MAQTAYLQLHAAARPVDPYDRKAAMLFETKAWIPFAWWLFFREAHLAPRPPERDAAPDAAEASMLVAELVDACDTARGRIEALGPLASPKPLGVLTAFVERVARSGQGQLVLDPYRLESDRDELLAPLRWLARLDRPRSRVLTAGADLWEDDDGISWGSPGRGRRMSLAEPQRVTGWPVKGPSASWLEAPESDEDDEDDAD